MLCTGPRGGSEGLDSEMNKHVKAFLRIEKFIMCLVSADDKMFSRQPSSCANVLCVSFQRGFLSPSHRKVDLRSQGHGDWSSV